MNHKPRFGLMFDFRNPLQWQQPWARLYDATIDFAAWTESLGFDDVWLTEHHGIEEDGYLCSPLIAAAAIAAKTKRVRIGSTIAIAPFYHPVRLAEDVAVVDIISNGRVDWGLGLGYQQGEFDAYGVPFRRRGALTNELLQIVRRLWDGETVTFKGEFFNIKNAKIQPPPVQSPMPLWIGGFNRNALKRAARYGHGYVGTSLINMAKWHSNFVEELAAVGRPPEDARMLSSVLWLLVSEDPEKTFAEVGPHFIHQINTYAKWLSASNGDLFVPVDMDTLKESAQVQIYTPEEAIAYFKGLLEAAPIEGFFGMVPPAGYPLEKLAPHVELFANKVLPAFR